MERLPRSEGRLCNNSSIEKRTSVILEEEEEEGGRRTRELRATVFYGNGAWIYLSPSPWTRALEEFKSKDPRLDGSMVSGWDIPSNRFEILDWRNGPI